MKVRIPNKIVSCVTLGVGGFLTFGGICYFNGNEKFYSQFLMPFVHRTIDAESAHRLAIKVAKYGLVPKFSNDQANFPVLQTTLWGLKFNNPIGLAAGFDKDGQAINGLSKIGFGFIEIGSVTPEPQTGNDKPRVFRLFDDKAIINRYGFNSSGHSVVKDNILRQTKLLEPTSIIGLNLGKNKLTNEAEQDYIKGLLVFAPLDCIKYFVVNISSPNTPNLRNLQNKKEFSNLIDKLIQVKTEHKIAKPLVIKISSDLNHGQLKDIANVINKYSKNDFHSKINGIIISNTTTERSENLKSDSKLVNEEGGLSGAPLKDKSTSTIKEMYKLTNGKIPIIGVGGVFDGKDAYEKIKAGASLVQIYTSLAYAGPPVVQKIKNELHHLLISDGFKNVNEAIGKDIK